MTNIIDFNKELHKVPVKEVFNALKDKLKDTEDLFIFYKLNDDTLNVLETTCSIQDKALMLQLLQHSINVDLNSDIIFE